ncbi:MAG TPA: hypothetical protein ACFYD6_09615 [Candidatus Brocadiia bacterium]
MVIRHVVEISNVDDEGYVIDAFKIKHGVVRAGKIWDLAGFIDFRTHLNLDFADHRVTECIIAGQFSKYAPIKIKQDGFVFAKVKGESYRHFGFVDIDARRIEWMKRCHPIKAL